MYMLYSIIRSIMVTYTYKFCRAVCSRYRQCKRILCKSTVWGPYYPVCTQTTRPGLAKVTPTLVYRASSVYVFKL